MKKEILYTKDKIKGGINEEKKKRRKKWKIVRLDKKKENKLFSYLIFFVRKSLKINEKEVL